MVLSEFLSRQNNDDSNLHEITPISFNKHQVIHEKYYNTENYLAQYKPKLNLVELNSQRFMAWERI